MKVKADKFGNIIINNKILVYDFFNDLHKGIEHLTPEETKLFIDFIPFFNERRKEITEYLLEKLKQQYGILLQTKPVDTALNEYYITRINKLQERL